MLLFGCVGFAIIAYALLPLLMSKLPVSWRYFTAGMFLRLGDLLRLKCRKAAAAADPMLLLIVGGAQHCWFSVVYHRYFGPHMQEMKLCVVLICCLCTCLNEALRAFDPEALNYTQFSCVYHQMLFLLPFPARASPMLDFQRCHTRPGLTA